MSIVGFYIRKKEIFFRIQQINQIKPNQKKSPFPTGTNQILMIIDCLGIGFIFQNAHAPEYKSEGKKVMNETNTTIIDSGIKI